MDAELLRSEQIDTDEAVCSQGFAQINVPVRFDSVTINCRESPTRTNAPNPTWRPFAHRFVVDLWCPQVQPVADAGCSRCNVRCAGLPILSSAIPELEIRALLSSWPVGGRQLEPRKRIGGRPPDQPSVSLSASSGDDQVANSHLHSDGAPGYEREIINDIVE